ncbi:IS1 ORF2 [Shigella flexneri]|nr:IS1 ORF2 [Shigella flexneri]
MSRQCTHYGRWPQHGFTSLKKLRPQSVTSRIQPGSDVIVCAEMDEHWGYVGAKSRQRWLFYAYDRIRRTVVAHVFGERTLATLERLLAAAIHPVIGSSENDVQLRTRHPETTAD